MQPSSAFPCRPSRTRGMELPLKCPLPSSISSSRGMPVEIQTLVTLWERPSEVMGKSEMPRSPTSNGSWLVPRYFTSAAAGWSLVVQPVLDDHTSRSLSQRNGRHSSERTRADWEGRRRVTRSCRAPRASHLPWRWRAGGGPRDLQVALARLLDLAALDVVDGELLLGLKAGGVEVERSDIRSQLRRGLLGTP